MSDVPRILAVDDEPAARALCSDILAECGYAVDVAADAAEALARLAHRSYDLVLTDLRMPGGDGIELIRRARAAHGSLGCVVFTAHPTIDDAIAAMQAGAEDFVAKPLEAVRLRQAVQRVLETRSERRESAPWEGNTTLPRPLIELIERVAATSASAVPPAAPSEGGDRDWSGDGHGAVDPIAVGPGPARFRDAKLRTIRHFERDYLDRLLTRCAGNVTRAARTAGLKRSALQRLMRKCGLDSRHYRIALPPPNA